MTPEKVVAPPELEEDFDLDREIAKQEDSLQEYDNQQRVYWSPRSSKFYPAMSGSDLWDEPELPTPEYIPGLVFAGALNGIIGPPKVGKTTYLFTRLLEYLEGDPVGPVVYITEQSKRSFKAQLKRLPNDMGRRLMKAKLPDDRDAFYVMHPEHHQSEKQVLNFKVETDWDRNLRMWGMVIKKIKPAILVIDTFGQYAELSENGENDNSVIASRLGNLTSLMATHSSMGLLLSSHSNKAGSRGRNKSYLNLLDIRGGSAYAGGLDHIVMINRPQPVAGVISLTCYMTVESRLMDAERYSLTLQKDGSYLRSEIGGEAVDEPSPVDGTLADIERAVRDEPGLVDLSERELLIALNERGIAATRYQVKKWRKV